MIGFEHKHPHHHLDVWNHTLLALSYSPKDFDIRLVLLLHDIGKPHSYQDEEIRHELDDEFDKVLEDHAQDEEVKYEEALDNIYMPRSCAYRKG